MAGFPLAERMKSYEKAWDISLPRRLPLIIRIDGRAFHSFTRGFLKPYDPLLREAMESAASSLFHDVSGAKLVYAQSDELSLLVTDYDALSTEPWFGKALQKIVSITASLATEAFSHHFKGATFDSRAFILPKEEVANYFIWRQQDATRNSIQAYAQGLFSPKQLHGLSSSELLDKMFTEKQVNWHDEDLWKRRGWCLTAEGFDFVPPLFTQNREYVEKHVNLPDEEMK